jgi:hypothetical protein
MYMKGWEMKLERTPLSTDREDSVRLMWWIPGFAPLSQASHNPFVFRNDYRIG